MLIDTHCHLNFQIFNRKLKHIIKKAGEVGVSQILVPGTDTASSKKAVKIAKRFNQVYAAVGIHPHHIFQYQKSEVKDKDDLSLKIKKDLKQIEQLLSCVKVVAIGEVGLDRHYYQDTKYKNYQLDADFIDLQKILFKEQIKLAIQYRKSLIIHSREAVGETLMMIGESSILKALKGRMVFHCCEAQERLLNFALEHKIFIGVDGDVTYSRPKQELVKKIPLNLLVLETDSPFLIPEPLKSQKDAFNEPKNLLLIADFIAKLKNISVDYLIKNTNNNVWRLFHLPEDKTENDSQNKT